MKVGVGFEILPFALADGGFVEVEVVAAGFALAEEEWGLVDAVDVLGGGEVETGEVGDGRHEVDGGEDGVGGSSSGDFPGPADDAREPVAAFVGGTFAVAERAGFAPEDRSFRVTLFGVGVFRLVPGTVVAGVDDEGVSLRPSSSSNVEQAAGFVVELLDDVAVEAAFGFAAEAIGGVDDGVHHGVGEVEDEGLFGVALFLEPGD